MTNRELTNPKKGQYVVCKHLGDNGDLLLGRIESVRSSGEVLLTNFLDKKMSIKSIKILKQRNHRASAAEVKLLMKLYMKTRDKQKVRLAAVGLGRKGETPAVVVRRRLSIQQSAVQRSASPGMLVLQAYNALDASEKAFFKDVLLVELRDEIRRWTLNGTTT